ncbi:MAG: S8 family serine peptidase [Fervidobacterium sp.]|uniref:S8 family serine peptidase n=1 Tax=Fervidobacterium sp. TaxID=1871331 RepID=UPI00404B8C9C
MKSKLSLSNKNYTFDLKSLLFESKLIFVFLIIGLVISIVTSCTDSRSGRIDNGSTPDLSENLSLTNDDYFPDRVLVGYEDENDLDKIAELIEGKLLLNIPQIRVASFKVEKVEKALKILQDEENIRKVKIRYAEPVYRRNIVPYEVGQGYSNQKVVSTYASYENYTNESLDFYLWGLRAIDVKKVWDDGYDGTGVIVAVLDTGVDGTHPDLQGRVVKGYRPSTGEELPEGTDSSYGGSHGTHVAGTIASKKDGRGIVGIAPGAKIMPIILFDRDGWYVGDDYAARGIIWAVDHGAEVLSNSWGGAGYSQTLKDAFDYALAHGVVVVAAAGNSKSSQSFQYPANYPGVIQVGAVEYLGNKYDIADFSSGSPMLSVSAPGVNIISTMPQKNSIGYNKRSFQIAENSGYYGFMSGTSMATPHVSGFVALLLQKYPDAKPWQIRRLLESGAIDIGEQGIDERSGYGMINEKSISLGLPDNGGSNLNVEVSDAYGDWKIPSVSVSMIGTSNTGKKVRYFAKTNGDGIAKFLNIDSGDYEVIISGPDSRENSEGLSKIVYRESEERMYYTNVSLTDDSSITVNFSSQAKIKFNSVSGNEMLILESVEGNTSTVIRPLSEEVDISHLSGRYFIKFGYPNPVVQNTSINATITLNGHDIKLSGYITAGSTVTTLYDAYGKTAHWTFFGKKD